jgi:hypothetical protein
VEVLQEGLREVQLEWRQEDQQGHEVEGRVLVHPVADHEDHQEDQEGHEVGFLAIQKVRDCS